jgi:hypothetical protein
MVAAKLSIAGNSVMLLDYARRSTRHVGRKWLSVLPMACLFLVAVLVGPLLVGVWVPDLIYARRHALAEQELPSGDTFRVIQYWNRGDFYNTELVHISPSGAVRTFLLDGDDSKSWSLPLVVDAQQQTATVTLSGGRTRSVSW